MKVQNNMLLSKRDDLLVQDYHEGEINEIARGYGIPERRVSQILRVRGISLSPRQSGSLKTISRQHSRIGTFLYDYRLDCGAETVQTANDLGYNEIKRRKVEPGNAPLSFWTSWTQRPTLTQKNHTF